MKPLLKWQFDAEMAAADDAAYRADEFLCSDYWAVDVGPFRLTISTDESLYDPDNENSWQLHHYARLIYQPPGMQDDQLVWDGSFPVVCALEFVKGELETKLRARLRLLSETLAFESAFARVG